MVFSLDCGGNEFDRGLLYRPFSRRIPEQQFADSSGREFLSICRTGFRAPVSRGHDFAAVLADSAVDVPAKAVSEDLMRPWAAASGFFIFGAAFEAPGLQIQGYGGAQRRKQMDKQSRMNRREFLQK